MKAETRNRRVKGKAQRRAEQENRRAEWKSQC